MTRPNKGTASELAATTGANASASPPKRGPRPRRAVLFRLAAVVLGLLPLVVLEIVLRSGGWGDDSVPDDPFVSFRARRPLFALTEDGERYEIPRSRQAYFRPQSFTAVKPPGGYRIFCLGGSTVQGRPYAVETSFTTWLALGLQAAAPDTKWEVVNCGGISYASYRLAVILEELLDYEPDLFIIYTGHNEFLEDRTYRHVRDLPAPVCGAIELASRLRLYGAGRAVWLSVTRDERKGGGGHRRAALPGEVDALLDYRRGLDDYHRDDAWRAGVIRHFRLSLDRMVRLAGQAQIPVLLVSPVSNLKDCPPFKSEHRAGLDRADRERFARLSAEAADVPWAEPHRKLALLEQAIAIDGRHAAVLYRAAMCCAAMQRWPEAVTAFRRAKEEDICPLRMLEPMHGAIFDVARNTDTPVVDARRLIEERSPHGVPGEEWLMDHVHPTIPGHQVIAEALMRHLVDRGVVHPRPGWEAERDERFREHLAGLGDAYFPQGQLRLESLLEWAHGRGPRAREEKRVRVGTRPDVPPP